MTLTKTLAAGVIAGTCVLGIVGEANATNLMRFGLNMKVANTVPVEILMLP